MRRLIFREVSGKNFMALGDVPPLPLDEQGLVLIEGTNLDFEGSNGAAKSSIFDLIRWILQDSTSKGLSKDAVINRYCEDQECVGRLLFDVDEGSTRHAYVVERRRKKKGAISLKIWQDGNDITAGMTYDTAHQKLALIVPIRSVVFNQIVMLSQDFADSTIAQMGETERVRFLQSPSMTGVDVYDQSAIRWTQVRKTCAQQIETKRMLVAQANQTLTGLVVDLVAVQDQRDRDLIAACAELQSSKDRLASYDAQLQVLTPKLSQAYAGLEAAQRDIEAALVQERTILQDRDSQSGILRALLSQRHTLESSPGQCQQCTQGISPQSYSDIHGRMTAEISVIQERITYAETVAAQWRAHAEQLAAAQAPTVSLRAQVENEIRTIERMQSEATSAVSYHERMIESMRSQSGQENVLDRRRTEMQEQVFNLENELAELQRQSSKAEYLESGFLRLRTEVMADAIVKLNRYTMAFASRFCEPDLIPQMSPDKKLKGGERVNKLAMSVNDETDVVKGLSGGERRSSEIAQQLACRLLAQDLSGVWCNLLFVDEILDKIDSTRVGKVMQVLQSMLTEGSVSTIFLISHVPWVRGYATKTLRVVRKDKIAHVESPVSTPVASEKAA